MEINELTINGGDRRRPQFRLKILLSIAGLLLALVVFSQLDPSVVRRLGPAAETVYDLFNARATGPLSLSGQRLVADVNALGGDARVVERTPGLFGVLARKELFSIHFSGRVRGRRAEFGRVGGRRAEFGDQELAQLVKRHGDRIWAIDLNDTRVTDEGMRVLSDLTNIRHLWLQYFHPTPMPNGSTSQTGLITDAGLLHVGRLAQLESLHLRGLPITDAGLEALAGLSGLCMLDLDLTDVSGPGLAHLRSIPQLTTLYLRETAVTDRGLSYLSGSSILYLSLDGVPLSGNGLSALKAMPSLHCLEIRGCGLSDKDVNDLKKSRPKLEIVR